MMETTWANAVATAKERQAIGAERVFLHREPIDNLDWSKCTGLEVGGSHRLDLDTSVHFIFSVAGLTISWWFDIEKPGANGTSTYLIDAEGIQAILARVQGKARREFQAYLQKASEAINKRGGELQEAAIRQFGMAAVLGNLAAHNKEVASAK